MPFDRPLAVKPALADTLEIVTLELPLFVIVEFNDPVLPTVTVLKFRLAGLAESEWVAV